MKNIDKLERKYQKLFQPWDEKREAIISGKREPEESELSLLEEYKTPTTEKADTNLSQLFFFFGLHNVIT